MTRIDGVLETSIYVGDLARSVAFYRNTLGLDVLLETPRLVAIDARRRSVLLIFPRGAAAKTVRDERGVIPGHDGFGKLHLAFAIAAGEEGDWRERLAGAGVPITGEYAWPRGGRSLYFEDPDGNVLELATPGLWRVY